MVQTRPQPQAKLLLLFIFFHANIRTAMSSTSSAKEFENLFSLTQTLSIKDYNFNTFNPYKLPLSLEYNNNSTNFPFIKTEQPFKFTFDQLLKDINDAQRHRQTAKQIGTHQTASGSIAPKNITLHLHAIANMRANSTQMIEELNIEHPSYPEDPWFATRKQFKTVLTNKILELEHNVTGWKPTHLLYKIKVSPETHVGRMEILKQMRLMFSQEEQVKALLHARNKQGVPLLADLAHITAQYTGAQP